MTLSARNVAITLPKREKIDVARNVVFSSNPCTVCHDVADDFHAIYVQLGNLHFIAYTLDRDFSINVKRFEGEIQIAHDSGWTTRMDMLNIGMTQVIFRFPEKDGKKEALAVYVCKSIVDKLKDC